MVRWRFWAVAFAFLVVMMFATLPSPLYGLYRTRDHLSAFTITVVFAIFAVGTIITLLLEGRVAGRFGRRGAMLGGVATMMVVVFTAGVVSQLTTNRLRSSRVLALGTFSMIAGLVLLVVAVRLSAPSLALFLIGGALIGAGAGAVYKGTTGIVLEATAPENRVAMTSALVIAVFVGLSVPVIGAGIALDQGASVPNTVLGFAILVALAVSLSGWALLGRRPAGVQHAAEPRQPLTRSEGPVVTRCLDLIELHQLEPPGKSPESGDRRSP
jgi:MFS family permease